MNLTGVFRIILLLLLVLCAIAVNLTKDLLRSVIIFMSYSSIMCIIWILMESPDLAITEAAVGAGISGTLFLLTLRRIREEDTKTADTQEGAGRAGASQSAVGPDGVVASQSANIPEGAARAGENPAKGAEKSQAAAGAQQEGMR